MVTYNGNVVEHVFLRTSNYLTFPQIIDLVLSAAEMYVKGGRERYYSTDDYEVRLYTDWETSSLGPFGGIRFEDYVSSSKGSDKVIFLIDGDRWASDLSYRN
ncbi:MAG: hypothetical protein HYW22_00935 [Candidatus Aenigmarchaeota archaeon]|nr:hypothetical protein [Candidatus Aenigmarchaeota archaeon]